MNLDAVKHALAARDQAEQTYRAAVVEAAREHGNVAVAQALGVTPQAVRQLVKRAGRDKRRLDELNAHYDQTVQHLAGADVLKDGAGITARRNGLAAKRKRKGLGPLPTLGAEALTRAETRLLHLLEQGTPVESFTPEHLAEAIQLRERLEENDACPF